LSLWNAEATPAAMASLAGKDMPCLATLDLRGMPSLGDEGLAHLLYGGGGLPALKALRLGETGLTPDGVALLARSPRLAGLTELQMTDQDVRPEGARALASSPFAAGLRRLTLHDCHLGDEGAVALAESPYLGRLAELKLYTRGGNSLTEAGGRRLRERFGHRVRYN
jgi:hypothetical protein